MAQQPKITFLDILNSMDINSEKHSAVDKSLSLDVVVIPEDVFSISVQAQNFIGGRPVTGRKTQESAEKTTDFQGNSTVISGKGKTLAQAGKDNVAWETAKNKNPL